MAFEEQKRFTECKALQEDNERLSQFIIQLRKEKDKADLLAKNLEIQNPKDEVSQLKMGLRERDQEIQRLKK